MLHQNVLGVYVHLPDGQGNVHEGNIVAAWLHKNSPHDDEGVVRVTIMTNKKRFMDAWLCNCTTGAAPKPEDRKTVPVEPKEIK